MGYLTSKKIYPGNWAEPLNGWYKNIDNTGDGTNESSKGGPTSVLAIPGYRYFQLRGYVPVTAGSGTTSGVASASVIIPSPYRQDDTRPNITGMEVSASTTRPAYIYRTAMSIASGWGDGRVASGVYAVTGCIISFGRDNSGSPVAASGEPIAQASISGAAASATTVFASGGSEGYGSFPFFTSALAQVTAASGLVNSGVVYSQVTGDTTFKVYSKASGNATATSGGFFISDADAAAGLTGYIVVELCYLQPDEAPGYEDIDGYLLGRTVS